MVFTYTKLDETHWGKKWVRWITNTNNLARAKLRRNILTESPLSKGRSKTPLSLAGEKKIASSLNSQNPFNFQTRRMVKAIFLFPASPLSHIQSAINYQITIHSLLAAAAIPEEFTTVAMLSQDFRYTKQEWANWKCQNRRRNELRFSNVKFSYPRGVVVVLPKGIWMQTFHKYPGDKAQNTTHHSDVGCHLLCSSTIPIVQALYTHWKSILHLPLPAELLLYLSLTFFFLLFLFATVGLPY